MINFKPEIDNRMRIIILLSVILLAMDTCMAKYTVYKFVGDVKVMRRDTELPIAKDLELRGNDRITIPEGGEIQILNSFDKSISISGKPGTSDVLSIIINAANDNPNVVSIPKKNPQPVDYVNEVGGITRGDFDPYLNDADCHLLGAALMNIIDGSAQKTDTPLTIKFSADSVGASYSITNTETYPLYYNVLMMSGDGLAVSPLGQEIGSYILNPGNGISRTVTNITDNNHFIIMSPCYFSVSELLGCIRENENSPLGRPEALPQDQLPIYIHNLE